MRAPAPVAALLGCATIPAFVRGQRTSACDDGGPWRCSHNGCASGEVSCFDLRYSCTSLLLSLVDASPSVASSDTVLEHCPKTCDPRCVVQAPPAEVDFVVRFAKSRGARAACPYWPHVGCLTFVVALMCDGFADWAALLQDDGSTGSVWSCCCPMPYSECPAGDRNPTCTEALDAHIGDLADELPQLPPTGAVLAARAELYVAGGHLCRMVLSSVVADEGDRDVADAPVTCGAELDSMATGVNRTIARQELHCEQLVWAWETLGQGDGDEFERNGCPFNPANRGRGRRRRAPSTVSSVAKREL